MMNEWKDKINWISKLKFIIFTWLDEEIESWNIRNVRMNRLKVRVKKILNE